MFADTLPLAPAREAASEADAPGRTVRRGDLRRLAVGYGTSGCVVAVVRLLEPSARLTADGVEFAPNVASNAPLMALVATVALAVGLWAGARVQRWQQTWATLTGLGTFVALAAGARAVLPWWLTGWLHAGELGRLTGDLVVLMVAGGAMAGLLSLAGAHRWRRRAGVALAIATALLLAVVPVADLVVRAGLGTQGVYFSLKDLALNPAQLFSMLLADGPVGPGLAGIAAVGLVGLAAFAVGRGDDAPVSAASAVAPFALMALVLGVAVLSHGRIAQGSLVRFVQMAAADLQQTHAHTDGADGSAFSLRGAALSLPEDAARPNVVVIVLESVGARAVGAYAPGLPTTPFLDSLARQGLRVEDLSTTTPYTNKALVSIFGGVPPSLASEVVEAQPGAIPSPGLAGLLAPLGYRSAFFTPARLAFERKDGVLANLGFDEVYGDGDFATGGFEEANHFGFEDRVVLDRALRWAEARSRAGEPFLMGLLTLTSHFPYAVPASAERLGLGDGRWGDYLDAVRYTDGFVRDLVNGVERLGLREETLFVIVGDHGEGFGEHAQYNHGNVIYEEALRVPGIVYAPGLASVEPGHVVRGPHQITGLVPTIADALGADWEAATPSGQSFLSDASPDWPVFTSCKSASACQSVRVGPEKVIYRYGYAPTERYDLSRDPGERRDLAGRTDPAHLRLREGQIASWARAVRAAYAGPTPAP